MKKLTVEQLRAREQNIIESEKLIESYARRHRIRNYIQGHVFYKLGDYPYPFKIEPTDYDYHILHECSERGAGLIQIHEEWNDALRVLGADKYTSHDPKGMNDYLDLCHSLNLKVICYASMGYMQLTDPDFRECFSFRQNGAMKKPLCEIHYKYALNSPNSPEWVSYIMPKMRHILDTYDFDGLYNDQHPGDFSGTEELFSEVYSLIKSRKGVFKLHVGGNRGVPYSEKVYDYITVGEAVKSEEEANSLRMLAPYVIPSPDYRYMPEDDIDYTFAKYIPFMQFPMLYYGRPVKGDIVEAPFIDYTKDERYYFNKRVGEYYRFHPNGPHVYSEWSSIPDNPLMKNKWFDYLALYKPMTEEDTICYINIGKNGFVKSEIPENVYVSVFTNEKQYLAISNLSDKPYEVELKDSWLDRVRYVKAHHFTIPSHRILLLVK